ncbi:MAG: hypothetical protein B6U65_00235 [Candidatus Wolframiiraptor sp. EX4484-121]|nr:MAG: hypothetical protein B6U65_00235 [Candidatus Wolframiiraptor sp. EX4484-121]
MMLRLKPGVVVVDKREERSGVPRMLSRLGISLRYELLEVGDYLLPGDILIERKEVGDFLSSLLDGRLFDQASNLVEASENPTILIEGDFSRVFARFENRAAVWGAVASLGYDFKITLLYTPSPEETANLIAMISKRTPSREEIHLKPKKKRADIHELQLNIVASLPGVGAARAKRLLEKLGTIRAVFSADAGQLSRLGGIPYETSLKIFKLLNTRYGEEAERRQEKIDDFIREDI